MQSPCTSAGSASPTAPADGCSSTGARPRPSRSSGPPTPSRWGLASRRRYRWSRGRVTDYWDEVFTPDGLEGHAALDDQSAFIASLGSSRSGRMRDVLGTIQADQDAIIRAGSRGTLVVDGGPGTGKTVVALHRSAYLLYADPRLGAGRGSVLVVGPHRPYLAYVADVLPSLGEDGVRTCTVRDLVAEGATAGEETDPDVARLKASAEMVGGHRAGRAALRGAAHRGDGGRDAVGRRLAERRRLGRGVRRPRPRHAAQRGPRPGLGGAGVDPRRQARTTRTPRSTSCAGRSSATTSWSARSAGRGRCWRPPTWSETCGAVPAYLRRCAPWLDRGRGAAAAAAASRRPGRSSDLPLLDAARQRLGDPEASRRRPPPRGRAGRRAGGDVAGRRPPDRDRRLRPAGDVDAARRRPARQARRRERRARLSTPTGSPARSPTSWSTRPRSSPTRSGRCCCCAAPAAASPSSATGPRPGTGSPSRGTNGSSGSASTTSRMASLTINYRTPEEVMAEAEPVIRAALPDANVPTSIRRSGVPVVHGSIADLDPILDTWLAAHPDGIACVIGLPSFRARGPRPVADPGAGQGAGVRPGRPRRPRRRSATASRERSTATSR